MSRPGVSPWALRRWPGHLLVLALLGTAVWLGSWQYDAWQAKREAASTDLVRADPVPLADVLGPDQPFPADLVGRPVTIRGTWLPDATVFVEREAGYWVVTPVAVTGEQDPVAVPVVRGVSERPAAAAVSGTAALVGRLQPPEGTGAVDDDPGDDVLPQLRVADLVQRLDGDVYGGYAIADEPTPGLSPASLAQLPEAGRTTGLRNFLYALEWWVFGGFAVFVWVRYLRDEAKPAEEGPERRLAP